jgi:hypothetical protein
VPQAQRTSNLTESIVIGADDVGEDVVISDGISLEEPERWCAYVHEIEDVFVGTRLGGRAHHADQ